MENVLRAPPSTWWEDLLRSVGGNVEAALEKAREYSNTDLPKMPWQSVMDKPYNVSPVDLVGHPGRAMQKMANGQRVLPTMTQPMDTDLLDLAGIGVPMLSAAKPTGKALVQGLKREFLGDVPKVKSSVARIGGIDFEGPVHGVALNKAKKFYGENFEFNRAEGDAFDLFKLNDGTVVPRKRAEEITGAAKSEDMPHGMAYKGRVARQMGAINPDQSKVIAKLTGREQLVPKKVALPDTFQSGEKEGILRGSEAFGGLTEKQFKQKRARYKSQAERGADYSKYWYDLTSGDLFSLAGGNVPMADNLAHVLATTSSSTPVGSNFMYGAKGWNQWLVGDPINTGKYPTRMSADIADILDSGAGVSGFKRSPYAGGLSVAWRPNPDLLAVNDIHNVRGWGIREPKTGKLWSKGVPEAGHRLLQRQTGKVVKSLNDDANKNLEFARLLGGMPDEVAQLPQADWNKYRVQASAWAPQRMDALGIPLKDASKHYGDYINEYSAQNTRSWIPGSNTGHLPELLSAPMSKQNELSNLLEEVVAGRNGIDNVAHGLGALSGRTLKNAGIYEGRPEPGFASQVPVGKLTGSQMMDPSSMKVMDAVAASHGLLGVQKQVAHNFLGGEAPIKSAGALRFDRGSPFSPDEIERLAGMGIKFDIPQVDPAGARMLVFDDVGAASRQDAWKAAKKAGKEFGAKVTAHHRDGNLFPVDENFNAPEKWSSVPFVEAIERAGPRVVENFDKNVAPKAAEILARVESFAQKNGMTQAEWYRPLMEGLARGGLAEVKRLHKAGIIPAVALAAIGLGSLADTGQPQY